VTAVQSCKGCGKLFSFLPRGLCADCIDLREERFQTVREWLRDNRGASVIAACQATGVEERLVAEFIREGRLEFAGPTESAKDLQAREALRAKLAGEMTAAQAAPPAAAPQPRRGMNVRHS
jgi:predicted amidophosphoribosyltransferase